MTTKEQLALAIGELNGAKRIEGMFEAYDNAGTLNENEKIKWELTKERIKELEAKVAKLLAEL